MPANAGDHLFAEVRLQGVISQKNFIIPVIEGSKDYENI